MAEVCNAEIFLWVGKYADIAASAKTIAESEMRAWLEKRVAGKGGHRPTAKKLAR